MSASIEWMTNDVSQRKPEWAIVMLLKIKVGQVSYGVSIL